MKDFGSLEKMILIGAVFFFSIGVGLIVDGKKVFQQQLAASERVEYRSTQNPF